MKMNQRRRSLRQIATTAAAFSVTCAVTVVFGGDAKLVPSHLHSFRHNSETRNLRTAKQRQPSRALASAAYCGTNWQDAHDTCNTPCEAGKDEECGPGRYCFTYMECTPSTSNSTALNSTATNTTSSTIDDEDLDMQLLSAASSTTTTLTPAPAPSTTYALSVPSYIASLPVAPSLPTTAAPFAMIPPTPNTLPNPNNSFCGYGWESANSECYHACPSGLDNECPNGRTCHTWLKCTPATVDPAIYSVCGLSWEHAASTCATRCFLGTDDSCPSGESCFGGVTECEDKLPALTAVDVGLAEQTYTEEEIAILLDEELAKERDEEAMLDPNNWWCGTSYSNMLETCTKRCTTDEDCKPSSWEEGFCFKTTGGPDNCSTPGVPVKEPVPEGSRWCGSTWNDMLESCSAKCEADEDCPDGKTCWEAPGTCQWIGVPVKEKSDPATLWCGTNFDDAMTSCHKACPGETNEECPVGMSCFSGSLCTTEGEPVVREGYRCGTTWDDASSKCGIECQGNSDCNEEEGEECFADVICESELKANMTEGMFCGETWESTSLSCTQSCEVDDDCPANQWCYWVECANGTPGNENATMTMMMMEPTTEATPASCDAEVRECPSGVFVAKAPELACDFYPCPEDSDNNIESETSNSELSGWGSTPLSYSCTSDGSASCGLCEGDCGSDDDCREGLLCFSRGEGEVTSVPGCVSGGEGDLPGMDYCYSPFPPATTTTTLATSTIMSSTYVAAATTTIAAEETHSMGNLNFARECTESEPCGVCEGDCDSDMQCGDGLKCFSRVKGSFDLVPGCLGSGIDGMDYCYDPNAPIEHPSTTSAPNSDVLQEGCSAEVRACPGGSIVRQDPHNNCEFEPCPEDIMTTNSANIPASESSMPSVLTIPDTSSPTYLTSVTEEPTISPITTLSPSSAPPSTTASASCDDLCLEVLPSEFCPANTTLPNCLEVGLGELCEASGECGTNDDLNNCDTYDILVRVVCGYDTPSQGQLMKGQVNELVTTTPVPIGTTSDTPSPTIPPVMASSSTTTLPTSPTSVFNNTTVVPSVSSSSVTTTTTSSSVLNSHIAFIDAIVADANSTSSTITPTLGLSTNNTTASGDIQYDRSSGVGGVESAASAPHEANEPAADLWYTMPEQGDTASATSSESDTWPPMDSYEAGDLTSYFQSSVASSFATISTIPISILLGMCAVNYMVLQ